MAVMIVQDIRGPHLVFDGEFLEKLPATENSRKHHVSHYTGVTVVLRPARRKLFGGTTDEFWDVSINCATIFWLWVSPEEKPQLDELIAALEAAKAAAP
jgi:hypothetical protein